MAHKQHYQQMNAQHPDDAATPTNDRRPRLQNHLARKVQVFSGSLINFEFEVIVTCS
jgi:hypothetical protein